MSQRRFSEAKVDFLKARELKVTDETLELSLACAEGEEELRVEERLSLYEKKMVFGSLTVVRKKSTGRYGAIDARGHERIPANYISTAPRNESERAFEREDHRYDVYNAQGIIIGEGYVTY
jgi:serine/threonine-protein kinase